MTNSAKTPTGKTPKGEISIYIDKGRIKGRLPRQYFGGEQKRFSFGMEATEENMASAQVKALRMKLDLMEGCFDTTLVRYDIIADLKLVSPSTATSDNQLPPKPELSLMEVWDMYCEYKKQKLRESHYEQFFQGQFKNYIKSAIEATKSEDALKIRNWLVENRSLEVTRKLISNLSKAHQLGIKNRLLSHNPYEGMAEEITTQGAKGKTQDELETDGDVLDKSKAYTWDEVQVILEYIENTPTKKHWHSFTKFKFLTGCRTGEAIALRWCDVDWDNEKVLIRATYDGRTKKFYPLKNDRTYKGNEVRRFPMPRDGELWQLLKSIPQGELGDVVFKGKRGNPICDSGFGYMWKGKPFASTIKAVIPELINQGRLTKYLPPYNTRHTFINHAIHDLGIPEKVVCYMCGHKPDVSNKHYQDEAIFMKGINPEIPFSQQDFGLQKIDNQQSQINNQKSEIELLREQNEQLRRLLEEMQNK